MRQVAHLPHRFRALDGSRGLCALLVVLFHAPALHAWKDAPAFANLQLCVDFFFVLSGFVLSRAVCGIGTAGDSLRFMKGRLLRLWPLHAVLLVVLVAIELAKLAFAHGDPGFRLEAAAFAEGRTGVEIVTNLFFLQGFGLSPGLTWNGPSWSIAAEFWVSGMFAATLLLPPGRRTAAWAILAGGAGVALWAVSPDTIFVSSSWAVPRCALGFFVGCLAYAGRERLAAIGLPCLPWEVAAALACVAFVLATPQGPMQLLAPVLFGLAIVVFSFERGPVSAMLSSAPLQALGRWSFSIYMTHGIVFQLARTFGTLLDHRFAAHLMGFHNDDKMLVAGTGAERLLVTFAVIGLVAVPVGALCHILVEAPLGRWLGRSARRRPPLVAAPTTAG